MMKRSIHAILPNNSVDDPPMICLSEQPADLGYVDLLTFMCERPKSAVSGLFCAEHSRDRPRDWPCLTETLTRGELKDAHMLIECNHY